MPPFVEYLWKDFYTGKVHFNWFNSLVLCFNLFTGSTQIAKSMPNELKHLKVTLYAGLTLSHFENKCDIITFLYFDHVFLTGAHISLWFDISASTSTLHYIEYTPKFLQPATWSHMTQYRSGYCKSTIEGTLRVRCSSCDRSTVHAAATAYPKSTLIGTPTCSSLSGTASYETHIAGKEESGCVGRDITSHSWSGKKVWWSYLQVCIWCVLDDGESGELGPGHTPRCRRLINSFLYRGNYHFNWVFTHWALQRV